MTKLGDRLALLLSLLGVLAAYWVADRVFDRMPHIEDEMAYVWQARVLAGGHITTPIPPEPKSFLVPFVVDYNGHRFGKYPLGWPLVLAAGEALGLRAWVNALLAGLGIWLTYLLGKRIFNAGVGLLAAGLTLTSPFFLVNSGSLLSHPLGLVLSAGFTLAWLAAFAGPPRPHRWPATLAAAGLMGALALTRPLTAVAVALPFSVHGLYLLARGDWPTRRRLLAFGVVALALASLLLFWQGYVTGDPFLNPYTLWWEYDKIGFGPGKGRSAAGHTLRQAWINTQSSLNVGYKDLFGWGSFSWVFLPLGLLALFRKPRRPNGAGLLAGSVFFSLLAAYLAYWVGAELFGPRYYFEGLFSLALLSAAGIFFLAGAPLGGLPDERGGLQEPLRRLGKLQAPWRVVVGLAVAGLVGYNFVAYLPGRFREMTDLYGISAARLAPFETPEAQALTPALVIVHPEKKWTEYGALLELESPFLDSPFLFVHTRGPEPDAAVAAAFPNRKIVYYYCGEPYKFYPAPREASPAPGEP